MRICNIIFIIGVVTALSSCKRLDDQSYQSNATDLTAEDVAWATGWQIWKLECPSPEIDGIQIVVLNENGDAIAGDGMTLAVNHFPEQPSVLRIAVKINGKSIKGRMSANNISSEFDYPNVFKKRHTAIHLSPEMENNKFILITESAGESSRGPIVRSIVLRLISTKEDS
jgi:hypothetical protein